MKTRREKTTHTHTQRSEDFDTCSEGIFISCVIYFLLCSGCSFHQNFCCVHIKRNENSQIENEVNEQKTRNRIRNGTCATLDTIWRWHASKLASLISCTFWKQKYKLNVRNDCAHLYWCDTVHEASGAVWRATFFPLRSEVDRTHRQRLNHLNLSILEIEIKWWSTVWCVCVCVCTWGFRCLRYERLPKKWGFCREINSNE